MSFDPYDHDPDRWGVSLSQSAELLLPCLEAAGARSVVEIGAFAGDLTRVLVDWAGRHGARVSAIDPAPQPALEQLAADHPELTLVRQTSLDALPELEPHDAVIVDGDHNWWTVTKELEALPGTPLIMLHDVSWPHARRDDYYDASQIPEDARQPVIGPDGGIFPGDPGVRPGALPYPRSARTEGGERNGVRTAAEDFVAGRPDLRLVVVPTFFGFGVIYSRSAPYAAQLDALLDPFDRNPLLERVEANRVHHLATGHLRLVELHQLRERLARQEALLRRMLVSSSVGVAERLSNLRVRAGVASEHGAISREEIRRVLEED